MVPLTNDRLCRCDRGPEAKYCEQCGEKVCLECLAPDVDPVAKIERDRVCTACQDAIWKINEALKFHRHQQAIAKNLQAILDHLESDCPDLGLAIGKIKAVQMLYDLEPKSEVST